MRPGLGGELMDALHIPVLLEETLDLLAPSLGGPGSLVIDCTLGLGGHAEALLERLPQTRLVGIDRDPQALEHSRRRLARFGERVRFVEGNFHELTALRVLHGFESPRGILADLGVSSLQLDLAERGFSFRQEGPLDMRMGRRGLSAREVVNDYPEAELERIFKEYGEERQARRIARAIAERRREAPLTTTSELREVIHGVKGPSRESRVDPATLVFQALRIEVNDELAGLASFLDQAIEQLEAGGRLVVISYHSLEDRIVKNVFRDRARGEIDPVTGRPLSERRLIEVMTRKPLRPGPGEVARNPRARSARLRAVRKL